MMCSTVSSEVEERRTTTYPTVDGDFERWVVNLRVARAKLAEEATISTSPKRSVVPMMARQRPLNALRCALVTLVIHWIAVIHTEKPAFFMNLQRHGIVSGWHTKSIDVLNFHRNVSHIAADSVQPHSIRQIEITAPAPQLWKLERCSQLFHPWRRRSLRFLIHMEHPMTGGDRPRIVVLARAG
jgi:hypothetical protein